MPISQNEVGKGKWEAKDGGKTFNTNGLCPGLDLVGKEILGGVESLPRSVLMCSFNRVCPLSY
uniref:DNA damage-binding protein 1 n=1 Tax=Solanum tuberosum TaxID=4113 RepID=M0ZWK7_SOLTU